MGSPPMDPLGCRPCCRPLRVLELYSGIGGMRYSLAKAYPQLPCHVKAVDINEVANSVYTHNFGDAPSLISIEHLCASDFDKDLAADLWTLSPPCQPFTTTVHSRQQDDLDHRSRSFLHLLQLLPQLEQPPTHLLLENVPAFLGSTCHQQWRAVLEACQYSVEDVELCPSQCGVPYLRPRAYSLATRRPYTLAPAFLEQLRELQAAPRAAQEAAGGISSDIECTAATAAAAGAAETGSAVAAVASELVEEQEAGGRRSLADYLELDWDNHVTLSNNNNTSSSSRISVSSCNGKSSSSSSSSSGMGASSYVYDLPQQLQRFAVPPARVSKYFRVLDVVTPDSRHANCFTKGYSKNIYGAGSVVATRSAAAALCSKDGRGRLRLVAAPPAAAATHPDTSSSSSSSSRQQGEVQQPTGQPPSMQLRFFTPREVANLHGLPPPGQDPGVDTSRHTQQQQQQQQQQSSLGARDVGSQGAVPLAAPAGFSFPPGVKDRQAYALLGNSLSVNMVGLLMRGLLEGWVQQHMQQQTGVQQQ